MVRKLKVHHIIQDHYFNQLIKQRNQKHFEFICRINSKCFLEWEFCSINITLNAMLYHMLYEFYHYY